MQQTMRKSKTISIAIWRQAVEEHFNGNEYLYDKVYKQLYEKLNPKFRGFDNYSEAEFSKVFNDVLIKIYDRTLNTMEFKKPSIDGYVYTAIRYHFIAPNKSAHEVPRDNDSIDRYRLDHEETTSTEDYEEENERFFLLKKYLYEVIEDLDKIEKAIIEGYLVGKKDKQIMKETNYKGEKSALSQKRKTLFKKIRKLVLKAIQNNNK